MAGGGWVGGGGKRKDKGEGKREIKKRREHSSWKPCLFYNLILKLTSIISTISSLLELSPVHMQQGGTEQRHEHVETGDPWGPS